MNRTGGMISLTTMAFAMAANLLKSGFRVVGYDIVPAMRRGPLKGGGVAAEGLTLAPKAGLNPPLTLKVVWAAPAASGCSRSAVR